MCQTRLQWNPAGQGRTNMSRTIFEVEPSGDAWVLRRKGATTEQRFATRDEAVESGRIACEANVPSRLRVRRVEKEN